MEGGWWEEGAGPALLVAGTGCGAEAGSEEVEGVFLGAQIESAKPRCGSLLNSSARRRLTASASVSG